MPVLNNGEGRSKHESSRVSPIFPSMAESRGTRNSVIGLLVELIASCMVCSSKRTAVRAALVERAVHLKSTAHSLRSLILQDERLLMHSAERVLRLRGSGQMHMQS